MSAQPIETRGATAHAVRSLRSLRTVAEVADATPTLVAGLGFDRIIVSDVSDGVWTPLDVHIARDQAWAADILEVGRSVPQELTPTLVESQMVRTRRPYVVREVQQNPHVNRPIALASKSVDYLAAPVVVNDVVSAFLHVDRYWSRTPFTACESEQLAIFAEALGLAIERATLVERLAQVAVTLGDIAGGRPDLSPRQPVPPAPDHGTRRLLTPREQEVADLVAEGHTNARIAAELFLSEATVKSHVKHVLRKLGASHRAEAVSKLLRG